MKLEAGGRRGGRRTVKRCLGILVFLPLILGVFLLSGEGSEAMTVPPSPAQGWTKVVEGGFNDPNNTYAPFWIEFKDHLYLSTVANEEGAKFSGSNKIGADI